jgi:hypothetical protein
MTKKNYSRNFYLSFFDQKLQFIYVQATEEATALKRKHPGLRKISFFNFFLCLWVILALLDPDCESDPDTDPGTPLNPDPDTALGKSVGKNSINSRIDT